MTANFQPNIQIAKNILLANCNFVITLKISQIAKIYQKKNLFIKYLKHQIDRVRLFKRLRIVKQASSSIICESILKI